MTTYAKCRVYREGDMFPFIHVGEEGELACDDSEYECWQPDELDDEEFNLVILFHGSPLRVRGCHFDFIDK